MRSIVTKRPLSLVIISLIVLLAAASSGVLASRGSPVGMEKLAQPAAPNVPGCTLSGPKSGLELNTVADDGLFKSVAMEKEIFSCRNANAQIVAFKDVETFIEIVENPAGGLVEQPRIEIATCLKAIPPGAIVCRNQPMTLGPLVKQPLAGCVAASQQNPDDPVVMTSAVVRTVVKTIKVEKEWFTCDTAAGGPNIRDIYIFTEILEKPQQIPGTTNVTTIRPFAHRFIGIVCNKDEVKGVITSCNRFPTN